MKELKDVLHPYYIINIIMSLSFIAAKSIPLVCHFVFNGNCEFESRQSEILFFLLMVIMIRARKTGSMSLAAYLNNSFVYCKVANVVLWFFAFKLYGLLFLALFFIQVLLLPQPTYSGPQNIVYFRDPHSFKEEISKEKKTTWMVEFYTVWNPSCVNFAPVFGELSAKYYLENLKFGKVDLARFPEIGAEFRISTSALSKQLPTMILFREGKPEMFRPNWDASGKLIKFHMNLDNIIQAFAMNDLYKECKQELEQRKKNKSSKAHAKSE